MNLEQFMENTGIRMNFLCEKVGITRQTAGKIKNGVAVSPEVADRLKKFCGNELEVETVMSNKSHVRYRGKKAACV